MPGGTSSERSSGISSTVDSRSRVSCVQYASESRCQIPMPAEGRESGRTEMPLLHPVGCLHVDRICLLDHMFASPSGAHGRCTDGIFLEPTRLHRPLGKITMDITEIHGPYRSRPLNHQGLWCCVLLVIEKKVLFHKVCKVSAALRWEDGR